MFRKLSGGVYTFVKKNSAGFAVFTAAFGVKLAYDDDIFSLTRCVHAASSEVDLKDALVDSITDSKVMKENSDKMRFRMEAFITNLQGRVIKELQALEPDAKFVVDRWLREEGGGGITCIVQDGSTFERAAVNISVVSGTLPPRAAAQMRSRGRKEIPTDRNVNFHACGISSVIHPRNPHVPTLHFNYRFFELECNDNKSLWWFGGGTDLTPYYLDEQDATHFHNTLKSACDKHDKTYYGEFKKWCDNYFVIKHRNEARGIGGIFFDDLEKPSADKCFEFIKSCGNAVLPGYIPLVKKNKDKGYGLNERTWQLLRRGRYVEFNLVYDRGTKFGLETPGARIESILVSLPLVAKWDYKHEPKVDTPEYKLMQVLKTPKEWANDNQKKWFWQ